MQVPDPVVLVIGATGYVGSAVVRRLARTDHVRRILAHVRPGSARADGAIQDWAGLGAVVTVDRTPLEPDRLAELFAEHRPTHVFLCHGTTARRARSEGIDDPYEAVDVGVTRLVLDAASAGHDDAGDGPRIVALSSVGADPAARSRYLAARGRAESAVRDSGLPFTICRAPLIAGPDRDERRPAEVWARRLGAPLLRFLGRVGLRRLAGRYLPMSGAECAEGLVRSGFHYMTIHRIVESDELRSVGVYERERWVPASRRDTARH